MKRKEMRKICRDVELGHQHEVEHQVTQQKGEVIGCDREQFEVKTDSRYQHWAGDNCEEESS